MIEHRTVAVHYAAPDPTPAPTYITGVMDTAADEPTGRPVVLVTDTTGGADNSLIGFSHRAGPPESYGPEHWTDAAEVLRLGALDPSASWWPTYASAAGIYTDAAAPVDRVEILVGTVSEVIAAVTNADPAEEAPAEERQNIVLDLTMDSGAEVRITVEYDDNGLSAVQALRAVGQDTYAGKLAVAMGLIPNLALVSDDEDEEF